MFSTGVPGRKKSPAPPFPLSTPAGLAKNDTPLRPPTLAVKLPGATDVVPIVPLTATPNSANAPRKYTSLLSAIVTSTVDASNSDAFGASVGAYPSVIANSAEANAPNCKIIMKSAEAKSIIKK